MSAAHPYVVSDEDEEGSDSELELLGYDSDASEPEITGVFDAGVSCSRDSRARSTTPLKNSAIWLPDTEIQCFKLGKGCIISPGDTVELKDTAVHEADAMHSGDFLRIKHIIMNLETDEVRLRGHRLRRTKYLGQIFDWKLNELSMVLRVKEDDPRCPFIAGMEDVSTDKVLRPRSCVLTNKPYPYLSFRDEKGCSFPVGLEEKEVKQNIFHGGRLACRVVNILFVSKNGKSYSGIVRHLYNRDSDAPTPAGVMNEPGVSRHAAIDIEDNEPVVPTHDVSGQRKRRARSPSLETMDVPKTRRPPHPYRQGHYTFGDAFCGAGGASQGAHQAKFRVIWGLDNDEHAIHAYGLNHPNALPFSGDAHDFPPKGYMNGDLRVDVLHLSPPCCFFSPAHTIDGPNDQANLEAIYTVGPILQKVKPKVATLEQTFGLFTHEQHKANFHMLLYDIGQAGYDLRYKVQDLSQYGLVQQRKRLIIIAAKHGVPLPPFPKQTHGPDGSGLKKFQYVHDALMPIRRFASHPSDDPYHQPKAAKHPRPPYSAHTFLKGCITTSGPESYHPSGLRKFTPRELSLFQGFPYTYQFTGSMCEATKQIGNAFPPIMAQALYCTIAKTLEAFDNGVIDAEDDLLDLDGITKRKDSNLRSAQSSRGSSFHPLTRAASQPSKYLVRGDNNNGGATRSQSSSFAKRQVLDSQQHLSRAVSSFESPTLLNGLVGDDTENKIRPSIENRPRHSNRMGSAFDDAIEVSSESEEDGDSDSDRTVC